MGRHTTKGSRRKSKPPVTPPRRSKPPVTPPTRTSSRVRHSPSRIPLSQELQARTTFKDSPKKLAFFLDYSNGVYSGEIAPGKPTSKKKTDELAHTHTVSDPARYFDFKLPHAKDLDMAEFDWEEMFADWENDDTDSEAEDE